MQTELSLSTVTATQEQVDTLLRELLPAQGQWSEAAYLWLTDHTSRLIEFTDGTLKVLPMPTKYHQAISRLLFFALSAIMQQIGGEVYFAPLRLQVRPGKLRGDDPGRRQHPGTRRMATDLGLHSVWRHARKITEQIGSGDPSILQFAESAFRLLLCRDPSAEELAGSIAFVEEQDNLLENTPNTQLATFRDNESANPSADPEYLARMYLVHALVNHNDFITVR
jgi:hypothetical protein